MTRHQIGITALVAIVALSGDVKWVYAHDANADQLPYALSLNKYVVAQDEPFAEPTASHFENSDAIRSFKRFDFSWHTNFNENQLNAVNPLNPGLQLISFDRNALSNELDISVDYRFASNLSLRGRNLSRLNDGTKGFDNSLLEGYLQWSSEVGNFLVNVGRVRVVWGQGYSRNPFDVLLPRTKTSFDP